MRPWTHSTPKKIYFNFVGRYIPPALQPVSLTPEEQEELKARDPIRWVGLMNTLKAQAEEIVNDELICN